MLTAEVKGLSLTWLTDGALYSNEFIASMHVSGIKMVTTNHLHRNLQIVINIVKSI